MNERQKKILKDAYKNVGLIVVSLIVVYMLGSGSSNIYQTFVDADVMGKIFYVLFGIIIMYNVGMVIRAAVEVRKAGSMNIQQMPVHGTPKEGHMFNPSETIQFENQSTQVMTDPFNNFYEEVMGGINVENDNTGQEMVNRLQGRIEDFNKRLDSDVEELEEQYKEMLVLREYINKTVGAMHREYKRLENQMQLVQGVIRTKKIVKERIKQLREV